MDAREQLRRYLEQRRELGESELVLDSLTVDDALRLLGAKPAPATSAATLRDALPQRPAPERSAPDRAAPPVVAEAVDVVDWRQTLRDAGATPIDPGIHVPAANADVFDPAIANLESLDAIAQHVASCTRCPLYATALNPVPGTGNPNADLMVVGEAPGATEDEQGLPFVGAAGQLLTKILAAIDLKREDVFICNVLKHRPPGNRNPRPEEVTACSPYLIRQIELVRPKVILALGTFAAQTLLDTQLALGKLRGQVHTYRGVPLVVTYHPAALLRNPSWKRPAWEDVQLARRILDNASKPGA